MCPPPFTRVPPVPGQGGRTVWRTPPGRPPRSRGQPAGGRLVPREGGAWGFLCFLCAAVRLMCNFIWSGNSWPTKETHLGVRKKNKRSRLGGEAGGTRAPFARRAAGGGGRSTRVQNGFSIPIGVRQGSGRNHGGGGGAVMAAVFAPYARGWGEREGAKTKWATGR